MVFMNLLPTFISLTHVRSCLRSCTLPREHEFSTGYRHRLRGRYINQHPGYRYVFISHIGREDPQGTTTTVRTGRFQCDVEDGQDGLHIHSWPFVVALKVVGGELCIL